MQNIILVSRECDNLTATPLDDTDIELALRSNIRLLAGFLPDNQHPVEPWLLQCQADPLMWLQDLLWRTIGMPNGLFGLNDG